MKSFTLTVTEQTLNQLFTVVNVAIKASGLQQEEISRLGLHLVDEIRKNAIEVVVADPPKDA